MTDFEGLDVNDVISKVKYALFAAQQQVGQGVKLGGIDIALKVVETKSAEGKPVFKVPVLEWELGTGLKLAKEQIQTINLKLDAPKTDEAEGVTAFDIPLTQAIVKIAEAAKYANQDEPKLVLGESSVEFEFCCTKAGKLTLLVFEGNVASATTSTLTVRLVAA